MVTILLAIAGLLALIILVVLVFWVIGLGLER